MVISFRVGQISGSLICQKMCSLLVFLVCVVFSIFFGIVSRVVQISIMGMFMYCYIEISDSVSSVVDFCFSQGVNQLVRLMKFSSFLFMFYSGERISCQMKLMIIIDSSVGRKISVWQVCVLCSFLRLNSEVSNRLMGFCRVMWMQKNLMLFYIVFQKVVDQLGLNRMVWQLLRFMKLCMLVLLVVQKLRCRVLSRGRVLKSVQISMVGVSSIVSCQVWMVFMVFFFLKGREWFFWWVFCFGLVFCLVRLLGYCCGLYYLVKLVWILVVVFCGVILLLSIWVLMFYILFFMLGVLWLRICELMWMVEVQFLCQFIICLVIGFFIEIRWFDSEKKLVILLVQRLVNFCEFSQVRNLQVLFLFFDFLLMFMLMLLWFEIQQVLLFLGIGGGKVVKFILLLK